jgi:hypothetical protein
MSIYQKRTYSQVYRKIYLDHHGTIPIDENGVSFDIHHIDGDFNNNEISNLIAVSMREHFEIHYKQGDYGACWSISLRMGVSAEEKAKLNSLAGKIGGAKSRDRVKNGTHNLLRRPDGSSVTGDLYNSGNHPFRKMRFDGDHNPRYDHTIYTFVNLDTKETVKMTQNDFAKKYGLQNYKGNLSGMIKHNKFKHVKRWTVLRDYTGGGAVAAAPAPGSPLGVATGAVTSGAIPSSGG